MTPFPSHELSYLRHHAERDFRTSQNTAFTGVSVSSLITNSQAQFDHIHQANQRIFESGLPDIRNTIYAFPPTNYLSNGNNYFYQPPSTFEPGEMQQAPLTTQFTNYFEGEPATEERFPNALQTESSNGRPQRAESHIRDRLLRDIASSVEGKKEFVLPQTPGFAHNRGATLQSRYSQQEVDSLKKEVEFCRKRKIKWNAEIIQYIQDRRNEMFQEEKTTAIRIAMKELGIESQRYLEKQIT